MEQEVKRFFIQLNKSSNISGIRKILDGYGFSYKNDWARLERPAKMSRDNNTGISSQGSDIKVLNSKPSNVDLKIINANNSDAGIVSNIITRAVKWSGLIEDPLKLAVGYPGYYHYLVEIKDTPVSAAALYIRDIYASLAFAGTLPAERRQGAQGALLRKRIDEAIKKGCKWLTVETETDTPDHPSPSYRNMLKCGFRNVYNRPNYLFEF